MRKIVIFFLILFVSLSVAPSRALAASNCSFGSGGSSGFNTSIESGGTSHTVSFDMSNYPQKKYMLALGAGNAQYNLYGQSPTFTLGENKTYQNSNGAVTVNGNKVVWEITNDTALISQPLGDRQIGVAIYEVIAPLKLITNYLCTAGTYTVAKEVVADQTSCSLRVWQEIGGEQCGASGCMLGGGVTTYISASNLKRADGTPYSGQVFVQLDGPGGGPLGYLGRNIYTNNGTATTDYQVKGVGKFEIEVREYTIGKALPGEVLCPKITFQTYDDCTNLCAPVADLYGPSQTGQPNFELCQQVTEEDSAKCLECVGGSESGVNGIWTAIGCIPTEPQGIIQTIVQLGLGIGGGVTLLLILAGAFRLSTASGDPKQAEEAKEQITSAVIGLLFIIFSITMLRFIGVQFLQIPGFGG